MKLTALVASVAALALTAGAAHAQTAVSNATYVNGVNGTNQPAALSEVTATFQVSGTVAPACVISTNSGTLNDLNFGTIGIYADGATSIENAFTVTGPRNGHSRTNLAGCNTSNTVTVSKGNGADGLLADDISGGYDTNVFQANIPYSVSAVYAAGAPGSIAPVGAATGQFSVSTSQTSNSRSHGAWRGGIAIRVDLPVPAKALIAGEYSDTVSVEIAAL
ncbi:MAG TPA: hypothetical protein PLK37_05455 [Terricaulis sp.]|nr:hypothetical protein [Terricaulis sp.]